MWTLYWARLLRQWAPKLGMWILAEQWRKNVSWVWDVIYVQCFGLNCAVHVLIVDNTNILIATQLSLSAHLMTKTYMNYHTGLFCGRKPLRISCFCGNSWRFYLRKSTQNWFQTLAVPMWLCGYLPSTVLMMAFFASFQHADSNWLVLYRWQYLFRPSLLSTRRRNA